MISVPDRQKAMSLIEEAVQAGAREHMACKELGISQRTLQRWQNPSAPQEDQRPHAKRKSPAHKLSESEEQQIIETINQPKFKSLPPSQIIPRLADEGIYLASESTFYRIMHKHQQQHHRGRSTRPSTKPVTSHSATKPNQV